MMMKLQKCFDLKNAYSFTIQEEKIMNKENGIAMGISLGVLFGTGIGVLTHSIGLWVSLGISIGLIIGLLLVKDGDGDNDQME